MSVTANKTTRTWGPGVRFVQADAPNTLSGQAYERIRLDIVSGRLTPGSKLLTEAVKERYGIGGSPMREALTRLAADGLLQTEGQKGFRVALISVGELADIGRVRLHLELQALADAIREGGSEWELGIITAFHRFRYLTDNQAKDPTAYADEWELTHRAFHFSLLSGCNSPWLLHICDRIYDQTERYRRLHTAYDRIPRPLISSHKDIFDAVLSRDLKKSLALTRDHIALTTRKTLADMLASGVAPDPDAEAAIQNLQHAVLRPLLSEEAAIDSAAVGRASKSRKIM